MSLAAAIRKNAEPLGQTQSAYKQSVAMVNTYVNGVISSKLPALKSPPPDWTTFVTAYEQAESDALQWVNEVMRRLLRVPKDVVNYNPAISQLLDDAKMQAQTLVSEPTNQAARIALDDDLTALLSQLGIVTTFISEALKAVREFGDVLPPLATELQAIATKSIKDAGADTAKINQMNSDIEELHHEINVLTAELIGFAVADGVALILGTVITIAAWPIGLAAWLFFGPVVAGSTYYIAIDSQKIIAAKKKIAADQEEITGLTADVATLKLLATSYEAMAKESEAIEAALQEVLVAWQALESDVTEAVTEIRTAISDSGSSAFATVVEDLAAAIGEWDAAQEQAKGLVLEMSVNDAELQPGMSSEEIKAALATGSVEEILDYYNRVGAAQAAPTS